MAVKQIKLQHTIFNLEYDEHKSWTQDDTALIAAVEKLIEYEIQKNKKSDEKFYAHANFEKQHKIVEAEFNELTSKIKNLVKQTDEFEVKLTGFSTTNINTLIVLLNDAGIAVNSFHEKLTVLSNNINAISPAAGNDEEEENYSQIEPEWEHFNEVKRKHYSDYDNQSIDICSFDDLEEKMKSGFDYLDKRNDSNNYYIHDIVLTYNIFIAAVNGIYMLWEELNKRIALLNRFLNSVDSIEKVQKLN